MTKTTSTTFRIGAMIGALMLAPGAFAQDSNDAFSVEGRYVVDAVATVAGGDDRDPTRGAHRETAGPTR